MSSYSSEGANIYEALDYRTRNIGMSKRAWEATFDSLENLRSWYDEQGHSGASNAMAGAINIVWAYLTCELAGEPLPSDGSPRDIHERQDSYARGIEHE